jgi:hypothetical protein
MSENGQLELSLAPGIRLTPRSVEFPESLPFEQWAECGRFLKHCGDALDFWKADWINFGRKTYGVERVAEAIVQVELDLGDLKHADVLNRLIERRYELTPEHHFVLAKAKLDDIAQQNWMDLSVQNDLSPRELQESVRAGSVVKLPPAQGGRAGGFASFEGLASLWKILRRQIDGVWEEWTAQEAVEALKFMRPIEEFAAAVREKFKTPDGEESI